MPHEEEVIATTEPNAVTLCSYRPAFDRKMSIPPSQRTAVEVRRVTLSYGRSSKAKPILNGINLNVPEAAM